MKNTEVLLPDSARCSNVCKREETTETEYLMGYHNDNSLVMHYARRFGELAVTMGFISRAQVEDALSEQQFYSAISRVRPRKLIGEILFENGWITLRQVEAVLEALTKEKAD